MKAILEEGGAKKLLRKERIIFRMGLVLLGERDSKGLYLAGCLFFGGWGGEHACHALPYGA